jgi:short-subunit dehydrogenase
LVLTARGEAALTTLAEGLAKRHGVSIEVAVCDLGKVDGARRLLDQISARGLTPTVLVNNAGFGLHGRFVEQDADRLTEMNNVNVLAPTLLSLELGRAMHARGDGAILMVASLAAHAPTPLYAAYGASKAYLLSVGEALHVELAPTVKVSVVSPGLMDTGFLDVSGQAVSPSMRRLMFEPMRVAREALDGLIEGKASVIPGALMRAAMTLGRLTPRVQQARMMLRMQSQ